MPAEARHRPLSESQRWMVLVAATLLCVLLYLLAPILSPFAAAVLFAYMGDPLVDKLQEHRLPRAAAVVVVFLAIFLTLLALLGVLLPLVEQQIGALIRRVPAYLEWIQQNVLPDLGQALGMQDGAAGAEHLRQTLMDHWRTAGGFAIAFLQDISRSGMALLAWLANIVLVPVVTFYLLRDWDLLVARVRELLPRDIEPTVVRLTSECDRVLAEFFRGQLLVMAALAAVYSLGLMLVGLELGLLIGLIAGLVSFVPYLGFFVGIVAALAAAFFQFHAPLPMIYVCIVFGIGQTLEGMVLTPMLVGDRIGLHPVAVIFAVLAGGQLFGFLGVLLALPVAAVAVVLLRDAHHRYLDSGLYRS